ncbi:glutathione-dependent formaldehyde dehydrogenase, partial [Sphingobacterium bambusae]
KVLDMCFKAVRRMGTVSIVGVYGSPYDNFPLHRIFDKGITIKQGQAPVLNYIDKLVELVNENKVVLDDIITHSLPLSEAAHGYELFDKKQDDCVKVVLKP